ncbi:hypothetical protein [Anatilimnocola floriformis]|uniref:hypothetical protein n=1 Tax=Anatilimnocola floriformis TaxID=2948575 RepID=UPI0020C36FB6|nr:hypothetical protein [Anatilimnocola floriformis]
MVFLSRGLPAITDYDYSYWLASLGRKPETNGSCDRTSARCYDGLDERLEYFPP